MSDYRIRSTRETQVVRIDDHDDPRNREHRFVATRSRARISGRLGERFGQWSPWQMTDYQENGTNRDCGEFDTIDECVSIANQLDGGES